MVKVIVVLVGMVVLLCALLFWEIVRRRALEGSHARQVATLMEALEGCRGREGVTVFGGYVHPGDRGTRILIIPKSEGIDGNRIEGNVFYPESPGR